MLAPLNTRFFFWFIISDANKNPFQGHMKGILPNLAFPSVPAVPAASSPVLCLGGPIGRRCCRVIRQKRCPYLGASATATAAPPVRPILSAREEWEPASKPHMPHTTHTYTHTRKQKSTQGQTRQAKSNLKLAKTRISHSKTSQKSAPLTEKWQTGAMLSIFTLNLFCFWRQTWPLTREKRCSVSHS